MLHRTEKKELFPQEIRIPHASVSSNTEKLTPVFLLCALTAIVAVWAVLARIRFFGFELLVLAACILFIMSIIYARLLKNRRLPETFYYLVLWKALGAVSLSLTYMCAISNFPLYDEQLLSIDRILGFDWLRYYSFLTKNATISGILRIGYYSLTSQIIFSIVFFSFSRRYDRNSELFCTSLISLVITSVISGFFPAAGTFYHYGIDLSRAIHLHDYFALRSGSISNFEIFRMKGIITFPSFHTTSAILLIYAYRGTNMFLLVLLLNVLMLLSTPIFGGHYLVDMLGGIAVAYFSILITDNARAYASRKFAIDIRPELQARA